MTERDALSKDQMVTVLDNAPVAIFVSAISDRRLLYSNRRAKDQFSGAKRPNAACYTVAGFSEPCPFCHVGEMSPAGFKIREFHHPCNGRIYQLSGMLIDWAGEPAHIEYILDITEKKQEELLHRKAEEELKTTFGSVPCGLCVYELIDGRILPVFHNPAFYELMGYSEEHIRSVEQKTDYLGVHPEDLPALREKIEKIIRDGGMMQHTYRLYNDRQQQYQWIRLDGAVRTDADGKKLLYGVYSNVSEQKRLEQELTETNIRMQDIVNAIPGGVAIYRVSDRFETVYFSDGVPELSGHTAEEYRALTKHDVAGMVYPEDVGMVVEKLYAAINSHTAADFEFRRLHRDGHVVWVRMQAKQIGEDGGCPLLQCIFHNVSTLRETQMELNHLVNSMPGGIASFQVEGERFIPLFCSDGVAALSGRTRKEYDDLVSDDAVHAIYEPDRERVLAVARAALASGEILDVSFRTHHKDGSLIWIHLSGRRIGPLSGCMRFYAVFTGMSEESRLFQSIANETADGIYVIDKETYELLYANESRGFFANGSPRVGQKCYAALHKKDAPCAFCTLKAYEPDGQEHEFAVEETGRFYSARTRETDWNGIPAYIQYIRDITEEVHVRREKERLEMYFQSLVENLPGGISVIRCEADGSMTPEYISEGFAAMIHRTVEEVRSVYQHDAFGDVHPDDVEANRRKLRAYVEKGEGHCELTARMKRGDGGYVWVKSVLSMLQMSDGLCRIYSVHTDISKTVAENERIRRRYKELLLQHYRAPGPDTLVVGHCNVTQNRILEIKDYTGSRLLETLGTNREAFFTGIANLVVEAEERQAFLNAYLNGPALAAFARKDTEQIQRCFIKLPREDRGRYVQFKVNLVETPDTGDITGILTVTDITEQTISERILRQLSVTSHDYVVDLDLDRDIYTVLTSNKTASRVPALRGRHSERVALMQSIILPKDSGRYAQALEGAEIRRRLQEEGPYTVTYSMMGEQGELQTKNITISPVDLRLGRVSLVCTDITNSVREQQSLLNMIAYTFDLAAFIHVGSRHFTMYTRQMVLEGLPPYQTDDYSRAAEQFIGRYGTAEDAAEVLEQFSLKTMQQRLSECPLGYDFVFPFHTGEGLLLYKQINVLWGDRNHGTVCIVRADVTDMLAAERESKRALEKALELAEKANRAKSEFLTSMSHDIRTPMNAIMGMTTLALLHLNDRKRVESCLRKISVANKHLLSLVNDVLDMSRIERSQIALNQRTLSLPALIGQLSAIIEPQAKEAGLQFEIEKKDISHEYFCGDSVRINQIFINLLSNAVKFTPEGGRVAFLAQEVSPVENKEHVRYRFTVRDTGIGMSEEFLCHLFDPFAREEKVVCVEGTGLGLSIAKGLVERMHGKIDVDSRPGKGSVFRVELEFEKAENDGGFHLKNTGDERLDLPQKKPFAGCTFLIAEDHPVNAELLCELLAMYGAQSVIRTDGRRAVHAFQEAAPGTYDAILMDIQMPDMTGYEASRAIRGMKRPDAKTIPIVAMTANAFAEDIQASLDAGMNAHVAKPIDVDVLEDTLHKVLGAM